MIFYYKPAYALTALTADLIVKEALTLLRENLVAANVVNRDYDETFAEYGDTVRLNKSTVMTADRLTEGGTLSFATPAATDDTVLLNQHIYAAFEVSDRAAQRSFANLVTRYIEPAARAMALSVDRIVTGERWNFFANRVGHVGTALSYDGCVDVKTKFSNNNNPDDERVLLVNPDGEGQLLKEDKLTTTATRGQDAIYNGWIGSVSGMDVLMTQTLAKTSARDTATGAINGGNLAVGDVELTVDGFTGSNGVVGDFCLVNGIPYTILSTAEAASDTTTITLQSPGLIEAISDDDVVIISTAGAIDEAGDYAANYDGAIEFDGFTNIPAIGDCVSFASTLTNYGVFRTATGEFKTNRPVVAAMVDDATIHVLNEGNYHWALNRDAVVLVNRPMRPPEGAISTTLNYNGLSIRVIVTYDHDTLKSKVSLDALFGIKTLDANKGVLVCA